MLQKKSGFTIIELLISVSLFTIIISITSAIFINSLRTQRIITALMAANSNASLAIEQIAREIRTGTNFCLSTCRPDELKFTNANGESVEYRWDPAASAQPKPILRAVKGGTPTPITADNVDIKNMAFYLQGQALGDKKAPRITLIMQVGAVGAPFAEAFTNLQTTLSARLIRIPGEPNAD
ncbi:MAG: type II secretion system protein [bacterium]|nr:type II secretion system protein [bacterium]